MLVYRGVSKTVTDWAEQFKLKPSTVISRRERGWSIEQALEIPAGHSYLKPKRGTRGPWLLTLNGACYHILDPRIEEVDIESIASALARECRFGANSLYRYSVAQHSVLVSYLCEKYPLCGLLHDSPEAYLKDMPSPIKGSLPPYIYMESLAWRVICKKFNLMEFQYGMPEEVERADKVMLATEARDLMQNVKNMWKVTEKAISQRVEPWDLEYSKARFLERFEELTKNK